MPRAIAKTLLVLSMLIAATACGYETSTTFNTDGSVTVGLKFLFPKSLVSGANGASLTGLAPADITKANQAMAAKYPGAKIAAVTEGDETGALITVPFKTEKDAFAFLTAPSKMSLSGAASASTPGVDLSNTGGLFATATHTTSGATDTYTFTTAPPPLASPSPGSQQVLSNDEMTSMFTLTFSLTVPHEITSADGALFTLDRHTAIWKLSLTKAQTFTATTGQNIALTGVTTTAAQGSSPAMVITVGLLAIAIGLVLGVLLAGRRQQTAPAAPAMAPATIVPSPQPALEPRSVEPWPGPPAGTPSPPAG